MTVSHNLLILRQYIKHKMIRIYKSLSRFSLDFSKLSQQITSQAKKNYKIDGANPIQGYMTSNQNAQHSVIMIHQWWGFNQSMTTTADIFSNKNIKVFVPDLYRGKPAIDCQEAGHKMSNLNWSKALEDINNIKEHLAKSSKSVSVIGFCMGGALTFASVASIKGFKAGGVFYGIPDLNIFKLDKITAKVIAHFGRLDPLKGFSDPQSAQKLAVDAQTHKYPIQVKIWQGASHAFCNQNSIYFQRQTRDSAFALTRSLIEQ